MFFLRESLGHVKCGHSQWSCRPSVHGCGVEGLDLAERPLGLEPRGVVTGLGNTAVSALLVLLADVIVDISLPSWAWSSICTANVRDATSSRIWLNAGLSFAAVIATCAACADQDACSSHWL